DVPALYAEHAAGLVMSHLAHSAQQLWGWHRKSSGRRVARLDLERVFEFIETNLHRDISTTQLSGLLDMGPDVFTRHFKAQVGVPPYRYVLRRRLQCAAEMLAATEVSLAEVAFAVGFSSQTHFTVQFGKHFGASPGAYRRGHRN